MGFHAIGDKATEMALDAYAQPGVSSKARNRIEHAQVVDPADIPRFAKLGVIASMQPNHLLTDMNWAEERLGPQRAAYSYAWKAFLDAGVPLAFGTDYPVEPITPFRGLYAAVTRKNEAGTKEYFPANKLTRGPGSLRLYAGLGLRRIRREAQGQTCPRLRRGLHPRRPRSLQGRRSRNSSNGGQRHLRQWKGSLSTR